MFQGQELGNNDIRPLHGPNLFPDFNDGKVFRSAILEYMDSMTKVKGSNFKIKLEFVHSHVVVFCFSLGGCLCAQF